MVDSLATLLCVALQNAFLWWIWVRPWHRKYKALQSRYDALRADAEHFKRRTREAIASIDQAIETIEEDAAE